MRSRAADALGKIGGPKVIDAVLQLVRDKDEDIRRAAIEILNQTKDERAVDSLIQATRDSDWWVSERAVDALAEIGSKRAVPRLMEMLQAPANAKATPDRGARAGQARRCAAGRHAAAASSRARSARSASRRCRRCRSSPTSARAEQVRTRAAGAGRSRPTRPSRAWRPRRVTELDNRIAGITALGSARRSRAARRERGAAGRGVRPPQPAPPSEAAKTQLISDAGVRSRASRPKPRRGSTSSTLKPGDIIEGRYKYIDRIGRGAFGTVLLMEDTVVDERLILKFLNPNVSGDEEVMKRFVHELRYSRKITHKNVIRIYDFLYIQGNYAISMEYFPSHTLGGEIVNEKPVELKRGVQFGIDICTGMTVAHQVGIVHRDLKPANVLINQEGLLKIVDFGVAAAQREGDTQLTKTGYVIGSPKYMAPEQILGKKVDERADIYALGVMLYEMVTGRAALLPRRPHVGHVPARAGQGARRRRRSIPPCRPGSPTLVMKRHGGRQDQALPDHGRAARRAAEPYRTLTSRRARRRPGSAPALPKFVRYVKFLATSR